MPADACHLMFYSITTLFHLRRPFFSQISAFLQPMMWFVSRHVVNFRKSDAGFFPAFSHRIRNNTAWYISLNSFTEQYPGYDAEKSTLGMAQ
jgi:hypothetical protein